VAYRRQTDRVLACSDPAERKRVIRTSVQEMKLAPERLEVEITYHIPEPIMNGLVAGAGFASKVRMIAVDAELQQWKRRMAIGLVPVAQEWLTAVL
jgi:hypothetical protein